jgi:hypothetical protein
VWAAAFAAAVAENLAARFMIRSRTRVVKRCPEGRPVSVRLPLTNSRAPCAPTPTSNEADPDDRELLMLP